MRIDLVNKELPRNKQGDPSFTTLEELRKMFTDSEIVELVNRALYSLEYQRTAHRNRGRKIREEEAPLKRIVKEHFKVSWLRATDEQIAKAREILAEKGSAEEIQQANIGWTPEQIEGRRREKLTALRNIISEGRASEPVKKALIQQIEEEKENGPSKTGRSIIHGNPPVQR